MGGAALWGNPNAMIIAIQHACSLLLELGWRYNDAWLGCTCIDAHSLTSSLVVLSACEHLSSIDTVVERQRHATVPVTSMNKWSNFQVSKKKKCVYRYHLTIVHADVSLNAFQHMHPHDP